MLPLPRWASYLYSGAYLLHIRESPLKMREVLLLSPARSHPNHPSPVYMRPIIARPEAQEFAPFYGTYVDTAASMLGANPPTANPATDIRDLMGDQCDVLEAMVSGVQDEQANLPYAPGKWSLKESIVHMSDTERVFSYRAMRIARGDATPLASFNQDDYVPESRSNQRTMADILAEFRAVRGSTLALVNSLDATALLRNGTASGQTVSTRAICWIIAGHAAHHINLTRDRYLPALTGSK